MIIITVTGYKGGIGKSTTAFHLAAYFSDLGKTVLIDGDPNRTAIKWAGRNEEPLPFTVADERPATRTGPGMGYAPLESPRPDPDGDEVGWQEWGTTAIHGRRRAPGNEDRSWDGLRHHRHAGAA